MTQIIFNSQEEFEDVIKAAYMSAIDEWALDPDNWLDDKDNPYVSCEQYCKKLLQGNLFYFGSNDSPKVGDLVQSIDSGVKMEVFHIGKNFTGFSDVLIAGKLFLNNPEKFILLERSKND